MALSTSILLSLPRELRDMVYRLTLITPPKWERHHRPQCSWAPRSADVWERPIFTFVKDWGEVVRDDPVDECGCSGRPGLGLLLTCRQIHAEAAPLFWRECIFSFPNGAYLGQGPPGEGIFQPEENEGDEGNHVPRRRFLDLIHYIIISPYIPLADHADVLLWYQEDEESGGFWRSISCFRGLKILELNSALIDYHSDQLHRYPYYTKGLHGLKDVEVRDTDFVKCEALPKTPHGKPKAANRMWAKYTNKTTIGALLKVTETSEAWSWKSEEQSEDVVDAVSKQVLKCGPGDETAGKSRLSSLVCPRAEKCWS